MATFILVHGAFHGAWCWERLIPALQQRGHFARAIDLPGMGADVRPASMGTLANYAAHVVDAARSEAEKPIIVGHSLGGATISEAGELAPEAIAGLVYLAAVLLPSGISIAEMHANGLFVSPEPPMRLLPAEGLEGCMTVPSEDVIPFMYHRADAAGQARAIAQVGPQPYQPMTVPVSVTAERWGSLPRAYIECLDDRIILLEGQRRAQELLPCDPAISIDSDHSPFYSATEELADALSSIAKRWQGC
jgi:pimeloyl-ACP methyl ester carboxylesterase